MTNKEYAIRLLKKDKPAVRLASFLQYLGNKASMVYNRHNPDGSLMSERDAIVIIDGLERDIRDVQAVLYSVKA